MKPTRMHSAVAAVLIAATMATSVFAAEPGPRASKVPHTAEPGPYAVEVVTLPSLPTHTLYYPKNLGEFGKGKLLPIVSFGNGGCIRVGTMFSSLMTQVASHGYLAIAVGAKDAKFEPPAGGNQLAPPKPGTPAEELDDHLLLDAITWAVAQNGDRASPLAGKLDTKHIAVMGQSCGGLQVLAVSHDPRISTSIMLNSGALDAGAPTPGGRPLSAASKDDLQRLHAPIAYFIGGNSDVAHPNAEDDFTRITKVPVFNANLDVGHGGTFGDPGAGWFGEVAVHWLDWRLKNDAKAAAWFAGKDCTLCRNPVWTVKKKGME